MNLEIQSLEHLRSILSDNQIDFSQWGQKATKPIEELWGEIEGGETRIRNDDQGICRVVGVANVYVKYQSAEGEELNLWEERREFVNGDSDRRNFDFLAEKGYPSEDELEWAARALGEELGLAIPTSRIQKLGREIKFDDEEKTSFRGLKSEYQIYRYEVYLTKDEFNPNGYVEIQENKKSIYFVWK